MKIVWTRPIAPLLGLSLCWAVTLAACAGADYPEESSAPSVEIQYLKSNAEVMDHFASDVATFHTERAFQKVELMLELNGELDLSFKHPTHTNNRAHWSRMEVVERNLDFVRVEIHLSEAVRSFEVRGDPQAIEFARLAFYSGREPEGDIHGHNDDALAEAMEEEPGSVTVYSAQQGRWAPPVSISGLHTVPYTSAGPWAGGRNCSGSLRTGTRTLGEALVARFPGARYYQGYNCRQIRGGRSMSVHGTGRALDVFVPLDGGQADNDLGDPIANWLLENAEELGIQSVIWDRTIWTGSRAANKARRYGGRHDHHDHLHIELTPAAANRRFRAPATSARPVEPPPQPNEEPGRAQPVPEPEPAEPAEPPRRSRPQPTGPAHCFSQTLGQDVPNGECVQMPYNECGGRCQWARCDDGGWTCTALTDCTARHSARACDVQESTPSTCYSHTLSADVPSGETVQMPYEACGGVCQWAVCVDSTWICQGESGSGSVEHAHAYCERPAEPTASPCFSQTLGQWVPHDDMVQMAYASCSDNQTCRWAVCVDGDWSCTSERSPGEAFPHPACQ